MQRTALALLTATFLATSASAAEKSALSDAQKAEIKSMVRTYLIENPEVISEALTALEAKNEKGKVDKRNQVIADNKTALFNPAEGTVIGNPKGDVTVVEFFDYNCGYCKQMFAGIVDLLKEDPKVRLVLKEYPILGPSSVTASKAALAARKQGKYSEVHLALLSHKGSLSDATVMDIAQKAGADIKKLKTDMDDPAITDILVKNHNLADQLSIDGTPSLIIGDAFIPGAIPKTQLVELIAKARK
jgi:protein-disulfide isomerase